MLRLIERRWSCIGGWSFWNLWWLIAKPPTSHHEGVLFKEIKNKISKFIYCGINGLGRLAPVAGMGAGLLGGLILSLMLLYVFEKDVAVLNADIRLAGVRLTEIEGWLELWFKVICGCCCGAG